MIFTRLAEAAVHHKWRIVPFALIFLIAAGIFGAPVSVKLPAGGYTHPDSESGRAEKILAERFGAGGMSLIFTVSTGKGVDSREARAEADKVEATLQSSRYAGKVISYWDTPPQLASALKSDDGRTGLVATSIKGNDGTAPPRAHDIAKTLTGTRDGVTVAAGGLAIAYFDINSQSRTDLISSEAIAIPITFLILIWIFGSLVASVIPLVVAGFAIAGTTAVLRVLSAITDISVFSLNLASALSLALAIDYTLFIISRYREEVSAGAPRDRALIHSMNTAGRTVAFSAMIVTPALAALALFPVYFLRSLAYAGIASVVFCLIGSLVVAPAIIFALGARIDALDIRRPIYKVLRSAEPQVGPPERNFWYRLARLVMRRAWPVGLVVVTLLLLAGSPFLSLKLGYSDDRALPESASSHKVGDLLRDDFTQNNLGAIQIVFPTVQEPSQGLSNYAAQVSKVERVTSVTEPGGVYVSGTRVSAVGDGAAVKGGAAYITVSTTQDPYSDGGRELLADIKDVPHPANTLFSGLAQQNRDSVDAIVQWVPAVLIVIVLATFILVFLMTGSVLLPVKAIILNVLSQSAALGAMVWIFQDGGLGGLGITTVGYLAAFMPVLIFCISFGISMDYEVFLLSRIREEWLKSDRTSAGNTEAVALGLARTGRIVTAAATVMAVVFIAMTASGVSFMRMLGLGLAMTVLVDAFIIRSVLVPAFMQLAGRANWWAPSWLARVYDIAGLKEERRHDTVDAG